MLVLTRNPYDPDKSDLVIRTPSGERIVVRVVSARSPKAVKVAVIADSLVTIDRAEMESAHDAQRARGTMGVGG